MKTRTIISVLLAFFIFTGLQAQQDEDMKMLFSKKEKQDEEKKKVANGGYGSFSVGWTQIDGMDGMVVGGRAGFPRLRDPLHVRPARTFSDSRKSFMGVRFVCPLLPVSPRGRPAPHDRRN